MKRNKAVSAIKTLLLALILAAGVSYISAWTGPTAAAPNNNVAAPLNVDLTTQSKLGSLFLNTSNNPLPIGLEVFGQSIFNGQVQITSGSPAVGAVLTSDATGVATWQAQATSTAGGVSKIIAGNRITISPTSGIGNVTITSSPTGTVGGGWSSTVSSSHGQLGILKTTYWGNAVASRACPAGYTAQITGYAFSDPGGGDGGQSVASGYICVAN